jgi:hypothetical protein
MGSSGMKRKGRKHLPKVGTRPAMEHDLQERRAEALHPFSQDPGSRHGGAAYAVMAVIAGAVVFIGVIAIIAFT